ncbi:MAG: hypothetical protein LC808_39245, partial [Actinobacteria bacterium]|nr:hypothetical protein [Actinomycetota bacterium]
VEQGDRDGSGDTIIDDLNRALRGTGSVVNQVRSHHLALPTACSAWNVRELLNHVVAVSEKVNKLRFRSD